MAASDAPSDSLNDLAYVRFIPAGIVRRGAEKRLRGTLVLIPNPEVVRPPTDTDPAYPYTLDKWPNLVESAMRLAEGRAAPAKQHGSLTLWRASDRAGGLGEETQIEFICTANPYPAPSATELWNALVAPKADQFRLDSPAYLALHDYPTDTISNAEDRATVESAKAAMQYPLQSLHATIIKSLNLKDNDAYRQNPAAPLNLVEPPRGAMANIFESLQAAEMLGGFRLALSAMQRIPDAAPLNLGSLQPLSARLRLGLSNLRWTGLAGLLGRGGTARPEARRLAERIWSRGVTKADASPPAEEAVRDLPYQTDFNRFPTPVPDPTPTGLMFAVEQVLADAGVIPSPSSSKTGPQLLREDPESVLAAAIFKPGNGDISNSAKTAATDALQTALVYQLIALTPELQGSHVSAMAPIWRKLAVRGAKLQPDEAVELAKEVNDAAGRRMFGIMAHPAIARAVRLIVDVEIPLEAFGGAASCFVTASFGNTKLWTAASYDAQTAATDGATQEYSGSAFTPRPKADPTSPEAPQLNGLIRLGAKFKGQARFSLASVEQNGAAEEIYNYIRSQNIQDASSDSDPGPKLGTFRSAGIALMDAGAGADTQAVNKSGNAAVQALAMGDAAAPVLLYAEDITIGYALDVGVEHNANWNWRSLVNREITYGDPKRNGILGPQLQELAEAIMRAAGPEAEQYSEFIRAINGATLRMVNRNVESEDNDSFLVPQQTMAIWGGDPLGDSTVDQRSAITIDPMLDLPLPVTTGLPTDRLTAPPRLEIGRGYVFGARAVYLGGVVCSVEDAAIRYAASSDFLAGAASQPPPMPDASKETVRAGTGFVLRRQERIGAPVLAVIRKSNDRPRAGRGEGLKRIVVRSDPRPGPAAYRAPSVAWRAIIPCAVPQSFAILHPVRTQSGQPSQLLNDAESGRYGPIGGLINVKLDPENGGFPVVDAIGGASAPRAPVPVVKGIGANSLSQFKEAVFELGDFAFGEIYKRKSQYYPDPAADSLKIQILSRHRNPVELKSLLVPVYNTADTPMLSQDLPVGWPEDSASMLCLYPNAIPIFLEVSRATSAKAALMQSDQREDFGILMGDAAQFRPFVAPNPPQGSVTVRRVRIMLQPGEDYQVVVWHVPGRRKLQHWFATLTRAVTLYSRGTQANIDVEQDTRALAAVLHDLIENTPIQQIAETTSFSVCHATAAPPTPVIGDTALTIGVTGPTLNLWLLRAGASSNSLWQTARNNAIDQDLITVFTPQGSNVEVDFKPHWETGHQAGATDSWFGGVIGFDHAQTGAIRLEAAFVDAEDRPGQPLPPPNTHGQPTFPIISSVLWSSSVAAEEPMKPKRTGGADAGGADQFNVTLDRAQALRNLHFDFASTRARKLNVSAVAISRFVSLMQDPQEVSGKSQSAFETRSQPVEIILPSTAQPPNLADIEVLQAFIWTLQPRNVKQRKTALRVQWRRPRLTNSTGSAASGCWYLSGEGEQLALLFPIDGRVTEENSVYFTYSARDPHRLHAPNAPALPSDAAALFKGAGGIFYQRWLPLPPLAGQDLTKNASYAKTKLLAFDPSYDSREDKWFVDLPIELDGAPGPYLDLAFARFQPYSALRDRSIPPSLNSDLRFDFSLSQPTKIGLRIQPERKVTALWTGYDKHGYLTVRLNVEGSRTTIPGDNDASLSSVFLVKALQIRTDSDPTTQKADLIETSYPLAGNFRGIPRELICAPSYFQGNMGNFTIHDPVRLGNPVLPVTVELFLEEHEVRLAATVSTEAPGDPGFSYDEDLLPPEVLPPGYVLSGILFAAIVELPLP